MKKWIPRTRTELIDALVSVYPDDDQRLRRMPRKQLYAIFFSLRRRKGYFS